MGAFFVCLIRNLLLLSSIMRLVKEIPHPKYKIQIHHYNARYIVKIELGQFEQTYKIGETDVNGLEDVENMITTELLSNAIKRFIDMRTDWGNAFTKKDNR